MLWGWSLSVVLGWGGQPEHLMVLFPWHVHIGSTLRAQVWVAGRCQVLR